MIDASSKTARFVASSAIVVASATTMAMNAKFGWSIGYDEFEKYLLSAFGIAIDICKVFGLAFAAYQVSKGNKWKAAASFLVWFTAVLYSFAAATGFASMVRSNSTAERNHVALSIHQANQDYNRLFDELETMKKNNRYQTSAGCTAPEARMTEESKIFCQLYWRKVSEVDTAKVNLPKEVVKDADPQITFLTELTGIEGKTIVKIWAITMAIIAEIVSSFGLYAFSSTRAKYGTKVSKEEDESSEEDEEPKKKRGRPLGSKNKPKSPPELHVVTSN